MKIRINVHVKKKPQKIEIDTDFIKLQSLLKLANLAETGGEAKNVIQDGLVLLNGEVCTQRGKKVYPGDIVEFENEKLQVIGH